MSINGTTMTDAAVSTIASVVENVTPTNVVGIVTSTIKNNGINEPEPIFLQTRSAQCISAIFVWIALFLTCQQVNKLLKYLISLLHIVK